MSFGDECSLGFPEFLQRFRLSHPRLLKIIIKKPISYRNLTQDYTIKMGVPVLPLQFSPNTSPARLRVVLGRKLRLELDVRDDEDEEEPACRKTGTANLGSILETDTSAFSVSCRALIVRDRVKGG